MKNYKIYEASIYKWFDNNIGVIAWAIVVSNGLYMTWQIIGGLEISPNHNILGISIIYTTILTYYMVVSVLTSLIFSAAGVIPGVIVGLIPGGFIVFIYLFIEIINSPPNLLSGGLIVADLVAFLISLKITFEYTKWFIELDRKTKIIAVGIGLFIAGLIIFIIYLERLYG